MTTKANDKKRNEDIKDVLTEVKFIKEQLAKLLLLIPKESLGEYKNVNQIKKDYLDALSDFPPA